MALSRLRRPCAPCAASSSARSFMPCSVCARTCWILTSAPSARSCARAFLLRATSALCLRDAQAPVIVQIASCESDLLQPAVASTLSHVTAWIGGAGLLYVLSSRLAIVASWWHYSAAQEAEARGLLYRWRPTRERRPTLRWRV